MFVSSKNQKNKPENQIAKAIPDAHIEVPITNKPSVLTVQDEITKLESLVWEKDMPEELKKKLLGMVLRLKKMNSGESFTREFEPISEYIEWVVQIPFGSITVDDLDINKAKEELQKNHYGLEPVKTRLMEYLAVLKLQELNLGDQQAIRMVDKNMINSIEDMKILRGNSANAPVLCFVGIQGVGKTTMAKSIASALGRGFIRIALGGMGSVSELRGRSRGELDAEPGQITKALIRTNSMNPLILLDEIDKVSSQTGLRSDVMASLLEILDPEQNAAFIDKYLDYPLNLSQCIFITTANNLGGISAALLDRLEVIRFGSYNDNDKVQIAKNYLLPKVRQATGLSEDQLGFDDDVWPLVIRPLGFDAGVRQLERTLTELARKVALQIVQGVSRGARISQNNFREFIPEQIGIMS
jgi:ATP-dependent Lon protease